MYCTVESLKVSPTKHISKLNILLWKSAEAIVQTSKQPHICQHIWVFQPIKHNQIESISNSRTCETTAEWCNVRPATWRQWRSGLRFRPVVSRQHWSGHRRCCERCRRRHGRTVRWRHRWYESSRWWQTSRGERAVSESLMLLGLTASLHWHLKTLERPLFSRQGHQHLGSRRSSTVVNNIYAVIEDHMPLEVLKERKTNGRGSPPLSWRGHAQG